jgi:transposase
LIDDFAAKIRENHRGALPVLLGIDEIYLRRKPYCVFTDIGNHLHFSLLKDNTDKTIKAALREYSNRHAVEVVVIDLTERYRDIARSLLPNAAIAIDLFHILQRADECREQVRIQAARSSNEEAGKVLRGRRDFWEGFEKPDGWLGGQTTLFGPLLPSLATAHETYIKLCLIFHTSKTSMECAHRFDAWVDEMTDEMRTHFNPMVEAAEKFRDEIFQYVDLGFTNGFTEGDNRSIRNQFRVAPRSSYKNFYKQLMARAERKYRMANPKGHHAAAAQNASEQELSIMASIDRSRQMSARRNHIGAPPTELSK